MGSNTKTQIRVERGDDASVVVIRIGYRSNPIIAGVLGTEADQHGEINKYYLNCLVHYEDLNYEDWIPSGAISTILKKDPNFKDPNHVA